MAKPLTVAAWPRSSLLQFVFTFEMRFEGINIFALDVVKRYRIVLDFVFEIEFQSDGRDSLDLVFDLVLGIDVRDLGFDAAIFLYGVFANDREAELVAVRINLHDVLVAER